MAGYDSYGQYGQQNAQVPQPYLPTRPTNRDAVLRLLGQQSQGTAMPRTDFPNLGTPVRNNQAIGGVVPSTDPANWNAAPGGVTDQKKFDATNFDALGNRDYLNKQQGGSFWEEQNGPAPHGWVYNANGGLMREPGWDKFDKAMTATTIAGVTGGTPIGIAAAAGGAAADAAYTQRVPGDRLGSASDQMRAASGYVPPNPSDLPGGSTANTLADTSTAADTSTTGAGVTLGDKVDTNGYAKPGYAVKGAPAPLAGYDSGKWNDINHQSPKYAVGRILSQYPQDINGLKQAMPEIIKAYPGAVQTGEDTIKVPGVGEIDVVKAGGGFWWGPETDENGNPYPKDTGGGANGGAASLAGGYNSDGDVAGSDVIKKILARLSGTTGTGTGVMSARDALLGQLGI
jgi:hypothetical protein